MSDIHTPAPPVDDALTIQHDPFPADDHGLAKRIPHLGHVALLAGILAVATLLIVAAFELVTRARPQSSDSAVLNLVCEACIYLVTLASSFFIFPFFWKRSFLTGIEWNSLALRRSGPRLLAAGVLLSFISQLAEHFITVPKHTVLDKVLSTQTGAWGALLLGVFLAPPFEEIVFRGFLLPALATAYDWLSLERTPAGLQHWQTSTAHSPQAKLFGALLSSILFALLHAPQLQYAWEAVTVIFGVGLVLAFVRLKTHSLACSTLVHMAYNGTLFAIMLLWTHGFRHLERLQS